MRTKGPGVKPLGGSIEERRRPGPEGPWLYENVTGPSKSESRDQSPYTEFQKSLLIRRDLVKMAKALGAEINDVVVKYTERKLRKDGTLDVAVMAHEMTQSPYGPRRARSCAATGSDDPKLG